MDCLLRANARDWSAGGDKLQVEQQPLTVIVSTLHLPLNLHLLVVSVLRVCQKTCCGCPKAVNCLKRRAAGSAALTTNPNMPDSPFFPAIASPLHSAVLSKDLLWPPQGSELPEETGCRFISTYWHVGLNACMRVMFVVCSSVKGPVVATSGQ